MLTLDLDKFDRLSPIDSPKYSDYGFIQSTLYVKNGTFNVGARLALSSGCQSPDENTIRSFLMEHLPIRGWEVL